MIQLGTLATSTTRTFYEFARLQQMDQWWHWLILLIAVVAIVVLVYLLYRWDSVELPRPVRLSLFALRVVAFAGLLFFFLQLEKRIEHKVVANSRAVVLVDTSQSMGLSEPTSDTATPATRIQQVSELLSDSPLVEELQAKHDVLVYRFDQAERPTQLAAFPKESIDEETAATASTSLQGPLTEARRLMTAAGLLLLIAAVAFAFHVLFPRLMRSDTGESWALLVSVVTLVIAVVIFAVSNLRNPQISLANVLGAPVRIPNEDDAPTIDSAAAPAPPVDWATELAPTGTETRLGDAIQFTVDNERGGPIAGVCVVTDGNSNAGVDYRDAAGAADAAGIKLYPVGAGLDQPPINARIVDIEAPARVYPGDAFSITAFLQGFGIGRRDIAISVVAQKVDGKGEPQGPLKRLEQRIIKLGDEGEVLPVDFEVNLTELGKHRLQVALDPPGEDVNSADDQKSVNVRIVDRKNRVLLFAGGPLREYHFVRSLLFRDSQVELDVLLQSSPPGAAQDADHLLTEFPASPGELFDYDAIIAFDPDWTALSRSEISLLERWVAEKAGGLVLLGGPVHMPEWTSRGRDRQGLEIIRSLYPVRFYSRTSSSLRRSPEASTQPWPLEFTDEGENSSFLWLDDSAGGSAQLWAGFPGVFGYQSVAGAKPGAIVYARFSDPGTEIDNRLPVYMAGHFYGAGRVFYLGSAEMWRLNRMNTGHFERLYTNLIRYVSEGRLLRDSSRGILVTDKDRCVLGDTVVVRATLTDEQYNPLDLEEVEAALVTPDGMRQKLPLRKITEVGQGGSYAGQFTATAEGDYRIELILTESADLELLSREVRARVPDREVESSQRNDAALAELASATDGTYFVGIPSVLGTAAQPGLVDVMVPQDQESYIPGTPDHAFQQRLMGWLLALICGALCLEWLCRRLYKLA